jgi:hypothetical protein
MMSKDCDLLLDYFNNELTKEQAEAFESHLLTCPACAEELKELRELTEDLPYDSEPIEPPVGMKDRVLSNIVNKNDTTVKSMEEQDIEQKSPVHQWQTPKKKQKRWYKPLIAAVLTASLIGNGVALIYYARGQEESEPAPTPGDHSLDTIQEMISLSPSEGVNAEATAMMIEQNGATNLVVQTKDMQPLEGEETYQVWVLQNGKPARAGTFILNEKGVGAVSYVIKDDADHQWDTIAITKEPNANSQEPKGDILLSSPI